VCDCDRVLGSTGQLAYQNPHQHILTEEEIFRLSAWPSSTIDICAPTPAFRVPKYKL